MRIAIFGASGATGSLLTAKCLGRGHDVAALVRTPGKFLYRDRVRVVQGDAFDADRVRQTVEGAEVVLSALGQRSLGNRRVLERAVPLILAAMKENGVRRIIALGAANIFAESLRRQSAAVQWLMNRLVFGLILKWPTQDQRAQYAALSASDLDWTMVLPPRLTNSRGRGKWRVDGEALPTGGMKIARADVAEFMVEQIGKRWWVRRAVYIAW